MQELGRYTFSIVGKEKSGKTAVVKRFIDDSFNEEYIASHSSKKHSKCLQTNTGFRFNLEIWDTVANDDPITQAVVTSNSRGIICSVDSTKILAGDLSDYEEGVKKKDSIQSRNGDIPFIILGTKVDLLTDEQKNQVDEKIQKMAEEGGFIKGFLCSAKEGTGLQETFIYLLQNMK